MLIALALVGGWGVLWHTTLGPHPRNVDRVEPLHGAVEAYTNAGNKVPKDDALASALDVAGSDPYGVAGFYDATRGGFIDVYGRPISYKSGFGGTFRVRSKGRDGVEDYPLPVDDVAKGELSLLSIELGSPGDLLDAAMGFVRDRLDHDSEDQPDPCPRAVSFAHEAHPLRPDRVRLSHLPHAHAVACGRGHVALRESAR